jgi:hypothetical protein
MNPAPRAPALVVAVLTAVASALLSPGLLLGIALAELTRRRGLRWTWTLLALPLAIPLTIAASARADALAATARAIAVDDAAPATALLPLVPFWLASVPIAAILWKLRRDRRDRLHGGEVERRVRAAIGPLQWVRRRRRRAAAIAAGAHSDDGLLLGFDETGEPVRIPPMIAHGTVVGGSNTGKTNTCATILEGMVADGAGFVVCDGKGGRDLPRTAVELGARYRRPVALWSLQPYGDPKLDALRLPWNVVADGNPTEIKDRIATSEAQSEPYYRAIASNGVLTAAQAITAVGGELRLDEIAALLEDPVGLRARLLRVEGDAHAAAAAAWIAGLTEGERSGLRGMGLRLRTMVASDGGTALLPAPDGREISLYRAIREGWLLVFSLPQGDYPELIPHVTRYVIAAINAVASRIERENDPAYMVFFVDELSAFDGEQLSATLERVRSAGIRVLLATQSLSNYYSAGAEKLLHGALDNAELVIVHRQLVPEAAELLASVGGTVEGWEHTHKVADSHGYMIGWDEQGERARRLADHFRVHPNEIKALALGQAAVISTRPSLHVHRRVDVRRALTADLRSPTAPAAA